MTILLEYLIACVAFPGHAIITKKVIMPCFITGADSRFVVSGGNLMIDPVMLSDDGGYTCEAANIAGTIRSVAYLNVQCKQSQL